MDFLRTLPRGRRDGPWSSFLLRTVPRAQSSAADARKCCPWVSPICFLSSAHPPVLVLSPSVARWARCFGAWTQRFVQVRGMPWGPRWDRPAVDSPPPPSTHPDSLCWLLHLSLTLGFCVLTIHSAVFIPSSLSSPWKTCCARTFGRHGRCSHSRLGLETRARAHAGPGRSSLPCRPQ